MTDEEIENIVSNIDLNITSFIDNGHGIMLTQREINILKKYEINYEQYLNIKSLLFSIEDILNNAYDWSDDDYDELDSVALSISERNYYFYTNH